MNNYGLVPSLLLLLVAAVGGAGGAKRSAALPATLIHKQKTMWDVQSMRLAAVWQLLLFSLACTFSLHELAVSGARATATTDRAGRCRLERRGK